MTERWQRRFGAGGAAAFAVAFAVDFDGNKIDDFVEIFDFILIFRLTNWPRAEQPEVI
ncbi:MAG: hypothetical protein ACEQSK_06915 [Sphingomonadaceae bacterium]